MNLAGTMVTASPPPLKLAVQNPDPMWKKLVVGLHWAAVYITELQPMYVLVSSCQKTTRCDMTRTVTLRQINIWRLALFKCSGALFKCSGNFFLSLFGFDMGDLWRWSKAVHTSWCADSVLNQTLWSLTINYRLYLFRFDLNSNSGPVRGDPQVSQLVYVIVIFNQRNKVENSTFNTYLCYFSVKEINKKKRWKLLLLL